MARSLPIIESGSGTAPPAAPPDARRDAALFDAHGRRIRDVRLSVTDRCNYRCVYCMDPDHRYMAKQELLSCAEYERVCAACVTLGVRKLRLTGGEPTLYPQFDELLGAVGAMGFDDIAMTTNGSLLTAEKLARWRAAGLQRVTFSLDSVRPERVAAITRSATATADDTARAIELVRAAGLDPVKVNAVVMHGVNDDEIIDLANFARAHEIDLRFIEWMPLDSGHTWDRARMVTAAEILDTIRTMHGLERIPPRDPSETSVNYRFTDGSRGRIGIIASVTQPFCGACSRMRITADGKVRPCLFSQTEFDLRPVLRGGGSVEDVAQFIADAMWTKQAGHGIDRPDFEPPERGMSAIGG